MNSKIVIGYCTFPDKNTAESIARELVAEGIIACANIFAPHTAVYSWQNKIQSESEVAALFKLNARKKKSLMEKIRAKHPYAVPALVFWAIEDGLPEYVNWVYGESL